MTRVVTGTYQSRCKGLVSSTMESSSRSKSRLRRSSYSAISGISRSYPARTTDLLQARISVVGCGCASFPSGPVSSRRRLFNEHLSVPARRVDVLHHALPLGGGFPALRRCHRGPSLLLLALEALKECELALDP